MLDDAQANSECIAYVINYMSGFSQQSNVVYAGYQGGTFYMHAGVLYNPLKYALIVNVLNHDGLGAISSIKVPEICASNVATLNSGRLMQGMKEYLLRDMVGDDNYDR
ncbi:hypothetical protein BKA67DRAFT_538098 [Truncatella angustata]|uniref:Uncharacterized protein n=1 Tax=Truncatella angustata TaxID=152316 RepID=A0A9P8ZWS5_9PEZI|nr:uncharacterized protein BKA67DRAFT_538098 [Truncatella angustata]KAH6652278.1 hypothetical protein BKA67DRAFT_538098 [Truncatella angustata]